MTIRPAGKLSIEVESFKALRSNTLVGFCDIIIPEIRLRIFDVSVHEKNGKRWVGLPSKPWVGRDGEVKRGDNGKVVYMPTAEFTDAATRTAFSDKVIAALVEFKPGVFDGVAA